MRGGADQLHAALMRLVIGPRALEARQERVVDVDAASRQLGRQIVRQDLHVARQHHEIGLGVLDQLPDRGFLLRLCLFGRRQMVERDVAEIRRAVGLARMVGDDGGRDHVELADAPAIEEVGEAVIGLGDQQHDPAPRRRGRASASPSKSAVRSPQSRSATPTVHREIGGGEHHPHEEFLVSMSSNCCASRMFWPFWARNVETAETIPGRSGQDSVKTN